MAAQVNMASMKVLIGLAKFSGNYTQDDITIMYGIATDIAMPLVAYDGTLIMLHGSTPSGIPLTVYLNSIGGSLLMRCGYYDIEGMDSPMFRLNVALFVYGDDNISSVSKRCKKFNHITYANFLKDHDMVFTMPDKKSTPTEFLHINDTDFLKRKSVYCPEVKMHMGALADDSIFKSLHSNVRSKEISKREQSDQTINGAIREWFLHGEEIYEMRREQLKRVANQHNLPALELNVSYKHRMEAWKEKYLSLSTP
jgi:hypothetical protein